MNELRPDLYSLLKQFNAIGGMDQTGQSGFCLLMALWQKANELGWIDRFTMTNAELLYRSGYNSEKSMINQRNRLATIGFYGYDPPKNRKQCGIYTMNYNLIDSFLKHSIKHSNKDSIKHSSKDSNKESIHGGSEGSSQGSSDGSSQGNIIKLNQTNEIDPTTTTTTANSASTEPVEVDVIDDESLEKLEELRREITGILIPSPNEIMAMKSMLLLLPVDKIISVIRASHKEFKPKFKGDKIRGIQYFLPIVQKTAAALKATKAVPHEIQYEIEELEIRIYEEFGNINFNDYPGGPGCICKGDGIYPSPDNPNNYRICPCKQIARLKTLKEMRGDIKQ